MEKIVEAVNNAFFLSIETIDENNAKIVFTTSSRWEQELTIKKAESGAVYYFYNNDGEMVSSRYGLHYVQIKESDDEEKIISRIDEAFDSLLVPSQEKIKINFYYRQGRCRPVGMVKIKCGKTRIIENDVSKKNLEKILGIARTISKLNINELQKVHLCYKLSFFVESLHAGTYRETFSIGAFRKIAPMYK